ncbi:MAG: hypothetical protein U5K77_00290 [Candidatus Saccharibacteria bacterium]|nr:hypothetical protein [Candidatus Saccharibacteria bacterium]
MSKEYSDESITSESVDWKKTSRNILSGLALACGAYFGAQAINADSETAVSTVDLDITPGAETQQILELTAQDLHIAVAGLSLAAGATGLAPSLRRQQETHSADYQKTTSQA